VADCYSLRLTRFSISLSSAVTVGWEWDVCVAAVRESNASEKSKIATDVNTYGTRIARILQGCILFVLFTRPASSQANSPPSQGPTAPETREATSGQSIAPAPNRPVKLVPRPAEDRERTYRAEHRVILNVFVADASGNPVAGLKQEDFTLLENERPQQIASFKAMRGSEASAPPRVLLMLDSVNNSSSGMTFMRRELESFLEQNEGNLPYPVSIVRLTDFGLSAGRPSRDGNALLRELGMLPYDIHVEIRGEEPPASATTVGHTFDPMKAMIRPNPDGADLDQRFSLSIPALASEVEHGLHGKKSVGKAGPACNRLRTA
jgi:hypothetical protein